MDDLIDRQAVIDVIFSEPLYKTGMKKRSAEEVVPAIFEKVKGLQPAEPERKTGVWLIHRFGSDAQCSECKTFFSDVYDMENSDNYCRHCGAKMEGLKRVNYE